MQIKLDKMHSQIVSNASGINWGKNLQMQTKSILKTNQGCGTISGDRNLLTISTNAVNDADILDSNVSFKDLDSSSETDMAFRP